MLTVAALAGVDTDIAGQVRQAFEKTSSARVELISARLLDSLGTSFGCGRPAGTPSP
ncbi:hypothetical protein [uncultured Friedmanniella sp.]|uniref:hypothetical protein n=1 Tax=uncultured Friedmanniella sp. TaxID=335381 RepID=UPI0035CA9FBC